MEFYVESETLPGRVHYCASLREEAVPWISLRWSDGDGKALDVNIRLLRQYVRCIAKILLLGPQSFVLFEAHEVHDEKGGRDLTQLLCIPTHRPRCRRRHVADVNNIPGCWFADGEEKPCKLLVVFTAIVSRL